MTQATAYPLTWPAQFPRKQYREAGQFKTTLPSALKNVQDSLRRFATDSGKKLDGLVISSNVTLGVHNPADPGVAVWFTWDGLQVCIPVDRYTKVESNLQAIHHIIEARRVELRHGTLALVRASFTGFKALPAPAGKDWRDILEMRAIQSATATEVDQAFRRLAQVRHPDKGGSDDLFDELTKAREQALRDLSNG